MGWLALCPFVFSKVPGKTKNKLNPAFKRVIIASKDTNTPASEILGIEDKYESFCINEACRYIYDKLVEQEKNKEEMKKIMRHSVKKGKK